jgi:hypothetical protein
MIDTNSCGQRELREDGKVTRFRYWLRTWLLPSYLFFAAIQVKSYFCLCSVQGNLYRSFTIGNILRTFTLLSDSQILLLLPSILHQCTVFVLHTKETREI